MLRRRKLSAIHASATHHVCLCLAVVFVGLSWIPQTAGAQTSLSAKSIDTGSMVEFAHAVAIGNQWAFVGEPGGRLLLRNAVFVYQKVGGDWVPADTLLGDSPDEAFGQAIALDGDRVFVGAPLSADVGAVYVFELDETVGDWVRSHMVQAGSHVTGAQFGSAVDAVGDVLVVGAPFEEDHGAAYVIERQADGSWIQTGRIQGALQDEGRFGTSVAVAGPGVVVGAERSRSNAGAAYSFAKDESIGTWTLREEIAGSKVVAGDHFGRSMASSGDRLLIGSPVDGGGHGSVHVFVYDEAGERWSETSVLQDPTPSGGYFGWSVAMVDDLVLVGAVLDGSAHLFRRDADAETHALVESFASPSPGSADHFGHAVSVSLEHAVVGAPEAEKAYLFENMDGEWVEAQTIGAASEQLEPIEGRRSCTNGKAVYYPCRDVDLLSFVPIEELGTDAAKRLNDIWGWTDPVTGTEYALVGRTDGTAFVDLNHPERPVLVGNLPTQAGVSTWRDVKVVNDHAVVVADNAGDHGMQVFDLSELREVADPPVVFEPTAVYDGFDEAHNVVVNDDADVAYAVGLTGRQDVGASCGPGLHIVDMSDPADPTFAGCYNPGHGRGYTHDAQCVSYTGPDADYAGQDICLGADEVGVSIVDVTDPANPVEISLFSYPDRGYSHQGWLTGDQRYFLVDDELDEINGLTSRTRTLIFDIRELEEPVFVGSYLGETSATDHNLYVDGKLVYEANYAAGLRILAFDPNEDLTTDALEEVGYFDVYPSSDRPGFIGSWSVYPYFESGIVVVSGMTSGLYILEPTLPANVSVEETPHAPGALSLDAYPNPTTGSASVTIDVPAGTRLRVDVFDVLGRRVRTLHDGPAVAGRSTFTLSTQGLPNGVYFVRASSEGVSETSSLVLRR